mmetsp:Transcript_5254/g.9321  ORF Transcript_5254/g.9321 Transcript_5254/m.9321 type:complete len:311 (+) Transcript_5254:31-963(+)
MKVYDVCIVGGGPAALSTLSAIHSPYSLDGTTMTPAQQECVWRNIRKSPKKLSVCVIDSNTFWLESWNSNFKILGITHLRSPALAHPDLFDPNALLSFAIKNNREDELLESGCFEIKSLLALGQSQIGLWKLPSTRLFADFCFELAKSPDLPHDFVGRSYVSDITKHNEIFELTVQRKLIGETTLFAKTVVLATGMVGKPIVPSSLKLIPKWTFWNKPEQPAFLRGNLSYCSVIPNKKLTTLVMGGGLTAAQVALKELATRQNEPSTDEPKVLLVSRRPLVEQHFDINVDWFDLRTTNKCMADFYHLPME